MFRPEFFLYLLTMAGVTYLIRMLPLVLIKEKIKNKYILSFLDYIPYTVLASMTVPAMFYATDIVPAAVGFAVAVLCGYLEQSLVKVAAFSCLGVLITELVIKYV
ncbi:MAG: AzlD domain-containing protein [Clostridia bacterium]|nr:AzlD domain-containing protein [Clostridia bacterium]